jgi:hypothetical protein
MKHLKFLPPVLLVSLGISFWPTAVVSDEEVCMKCHALRHVATKSKLGWTYEDKTTIECEHKGCIHNWCLQSGKTRWLSAVMPTRIRIVYGECLIAGCSP